jgi:hypothetical protein
MYLKQMNREECETDRMLNVVDTKNCLTEEELQELKKLAHLSITTRWIVGVLFAIVAMTGAPSFIDWVGRAFGLIVFKH